MTARIFDIWRHRTKKIKVEAYAIYLAYVDPRVPWYAKLLVVCVVGYFFSPVDKLLDSIPIIKYLDHLILVPLGVTFAFRKMLQPAVLTDCRERASIAMSRKKPANWIDGFIIISFWFLFASLTIVFTVLIMKDWNLVLMWWFRWFMRITKLRNQSSAYSGG